MRALCLAVPLLFAAPSLASADDVGLATIETLRARAATRGWTRSDVASPVAHEVWCAAPPCATEVDRLELTVRDGALVELRVIDHGVGDGFVLDASWQASGAFTFRFARGEEVVDLTWELTYEPPGMSVGFSARDTAEVVALDPADGAHAFELWIRRELSRYLASSTSLRETALDQRTALRDAVARGLVTSAAIRVGSAGACLVERATDRGTGFFDECTYRTATPEERRAALATLDARLARERRLLSRHARRWHRVLVDALGSVAPTP
jgi:hypothetical protein